MQAWASQTLHNLFYSEMLLNPERESQCKEKLQILLLSQPKEFAKRRIS